MKIELKPIGIIRSPYKTKEEIPIQAYRSEEVGEIELFKEYEEGLKDIEGFSHIVILYIFHKSQGYSLHVKPYLDTNLRGLFTTRYPDRPNPIGISTVKLLGREGNILRIQGMDVLDGTPLIDIKPFVPKFDDREGVRFGWLEEKLGD